MDKAEASNEQLPETTADASEPTGTSVTRSSCRGCNLWDEVRERVRVTELLENAIEKMGTRLKSDDFKPSLADYLKLMQLEKEFNQEQVKEIKVTWVAPSPSQELDK